MVVRWKSAALGIALVMCMVYMWSTWTVSLSMTGKHTATATTAAHKEVENNSNGQPSASLAPNTMVAVVQQQGAVKGTSRTGNTGGASNDPPATTAHVAAAATTTNARAATPMAVKEDAATESEAYWDELERRTREVTAKGCLRDFDAAAGSPTTRPDHPEVQKLNSYVSSCTMEDNSPELDLALRRAALVFDEDTGNLKPATEFPTMGTRPGDTKPDLPRPASEPMVYFTVARFVLPGILRNWAAWHKAAGVHRFIIVAATERVYFQVKALGYPVVSGTEWTRRWGMCDLRWRDFEDAEYKAGRRKTAPAIADQASGVKVLMAMEITRRGYTAVYNDADALLFRPFPLHDMTADFSFTQYCFLDCTRPDQRRYMLANWVPWDHLKKASYSWINFGQWAMRGNRRTTQMLLQLMRRMISYDGEGIRASCDDQHNMIEEFKARPEQVCHVFEDDDVHIYLNRENASKDCVSIRLLHPCRYLVYNTMSKSAFAPSVIAHKDTVGMHLTGFFSPQLKTMPLRHLLLWRGSEPAYYTQGKYLSFTLDPQRASEDAIRQQMHYAFGIARALGRKLILPLFPDPRPQPPAASSSPESAKGKVRWCPFEYLYEYWPTYVHSAGVPNTFEDLLRESTFLQDPRTAALAASSTAPIPVTRSMRGEDVPEYFKAHADASILVLATLAADVRFLNFTDGGPDSQFQDGFKNILRPSSSAEAGLDQTTQSVCPTPGVYPADKPPFPIQEE